MEGDRIDIPAAPSQPVECPDWITGEIIAETQRTWAVRFSGSLSEQEAIGLILSMGQLLDATGLTSTATTE